MLQEHIMEKQGMARHEATQIIQQKSLTDLKPKGIRKCDCNHVNIAIIVNRFRLSEKPEHGKTDIKYACLRARCTHHKARHDNPSIHPASRHGKNKNIACTDQLQQARQNC